MAWKGWEDFDPTAHEKAVREQGNPDKPKKPSKHHNVKVTLDGKTFDSKREANRWLMLTGAQSRGEITDLRRQVNFDLTAIERNHPERGFQTVGKFRADFTYYEKGKFVVEDSKGQRTDFYSWKARHFEIEYGFKIRET